MKVSVLIPTLNRLSYLKESLASARRQSHDDLEILVSDDGSADGTANYVREIMSEDFRVRLAPRNPRPGLFDNINHLVRHHAGEAFCILADDDRLLPQFVERLVEPLARDGGIVASFCDHWIVDGGGGLLSEATDFNSSAYGRANLPAGEVIDALTLAMRGGMCMGFSLYRSSIFRREEFDLQCGGAADFDYAIRAAQLGRLYFAKERLGEYRAHDATTTATRPAYMIEGIIRVFDNHSFEEPRHERMRREILRSKYRIKALYSCVLDRAEWWRSVRRYVELGGQPLDPRIVFSASLAALPRSAAPRVKGALKNLGGAGGLGRLARAFRRAGGVSGQGKMN